ncbi:VapE domain-containing protein [Fructobacillus tropaeoli]|uniref:Predicted P-loop ATPase and inactivated derivatives n=1 Tax=Fructobacillus tropaeoli TaxID=709323 RepID=A0ABN9YW33_9LACO|nr:Predicted P-loop ATPase and inactivated derivatives [Fructobacillus tropaeoli]
MALRAELATRLNNDMKIGHDDFLEDDFLLEDFEDDSLNIKIKKGQIDSNINILINLYLERKTEKSLSSRNVSEAIKMAGIENRFSSSQQWIKSKKWDKKPRLWDIGSKLFGIADNRVNRAIGIWVVHLVAGADGENIGTFQYTLDIIGNQGTGKTSFLKKIGQEFYTDQITSFKDKDDQMKMLVCLLVNDDEMQVSKGEKQEKEFKKFVSTDVFSYRKPYDSKATHKNRHFVIARTTNNSDYLTDLTGNRRVIPVLVSKKKIVNPSYELPEEWYNNVLAEAYQYYQDHDLYTLNRELDNCDFTDITEGLNENIDIKDNVLGIIKKDYPKEKVVPMAELKSKVLESDINYWASRKDKAIIKSQVNDVMTYLGYTQGRTYINGKQIRSYVLEEDGS